MSDGQKLTPVWVYDATGGSRLVDLPEGGEPPKGWFFSPPSGVVLAGDTASPATPATPLTPNERMDELELRLLRIESQIGALLQTVAMQPKAEPVKAAEPVANPERDALWARARELKISAGPRTGDDKLRALIAEAEAAAAKSVEES